MSYAALENAVIARLQGLTDYFVSTSHVTQGDFSVLGKGVTRAAVTMPGAIGAAENIVWTRAWDVLVNLFQRYTNPADTHTAFVAMRDAVLDAIDNDPNWGGLANGTVVIAENDMLDVNMRNAPEGSPPIFVTQELRLSIYQDEQ